MPMTIYGNELSQIILGNAEELLDSQVADASVDLIFVDPPYNIGKKFADFHDKWPSDREYAEWCYRWIDICVRKLRSTGSMYLMASTQAMPYLDLYIRDRLTVLSRIVWAYDSSGVQARNSLWFSLGADTILCKRRE